MRRSSSPISLFQLRQSLPLPWRPGPCHHTCQLYERSSRLHLPRILYRSQQLPQLGELPTPSSPLLVINRLTVPSAGHDSQLGLLLYALAALTLAMPANSRARQPSPSSAFFPTSGSMLVPVLSSSESSVGSSTSSPFSTCASKVSALRHDCLALRLISRSSLRHLLRAPLWSPRRRGIDE